MAHSNESYNSLLEKIPAGLTLKIFKHQISLNGVVQEPQLVYCADIDHSSIP
jgi:hypothetical protein